MNQSPHLKFGWLIAIAGLLTAYLFGFFVDVMDIDAAQYASIAREMLTDKSYLQVTHWHSAYLDKPPLLFWLSCLSFKILGVSTFAYKLPSFLFSLLGFYSLYRFARLYYDEAAARLSAIILASCQAMFLINNDVRTDTLLMGSVIFSVWQIAAYLKDGRFLNLIGGSAGIGLAMLAKGPIGLVIPVFAFTGDALLRKNFRQLLQWKWLIGLLIIAVTLTPMCIGLYRQFGWIGLKFYFWTQSFGRITGDSEWKNDAGDLYLIHEFLWAFLPWTALFAYALFLRLKDVFQKKPSSEFITLSGFMLTFIALSLSRYKLPHYIFVIAPFAAVMTAHFIAKFPKRVAWFQLPLILLAWAFTALVSFGIFPVKSWLLWSALLVFFFTAIFFLFKNSKEHVIATLLTIGAFNILLNAHVYPALLKYQPSRQIAERLQKENAPVRNFFTYKTNSHSLDFYCGMVAQGIYEPERLKAKAADSLWLYVREKDFREVVVLNIPFTVIDSFDFYSVSNLSPEFVNPETREKKVSKVYLLEF